MKRFYSVWPPGAVAALVFGLTFVPLAAMAGFSVDENPREILLDPGDVFLPGGICEVDDGDGSCPVAPTLRLFPPQYDPLQFDLDAFAVEEPVQVCQTGIPPQPGILFSFDDGDPGPGAGAPDNATEIFFYDHCQVLGPRQSWFTTISEVALGLGANPPPTAADDDVDAYETRDATSHWFAEFNLIFSPDSPSTGGGGLVAGNIYWVNMFAGPGIWGTPFNLGVPNPSNCDIDGISPVFDPLFPSWQILFTTDANAPCGLDPGDIYASDNGGNLWLYADDVIDMKIAATENDEVDIDALAINTGGGFQITDPFEPTCENSPWPDCGGDCPPGEICNQDPLGGQFCVCLPEEPCEQTFPTCDGPCPPGTECINTGTACVCEPIVCEQTFPTCDAPCPPGTECINIGDACVCEPIVCEQTFPTCDGPCPPGMECINTGTACVCEPIVCEQTFPTCDGPCPPGMECINIGDACVCEPIVCEQTFPTCDGPCPPGMECINTGTACVCEPIVCEQTFPTCDGPCPPGMECINTGTACVCEPIVCEQTFPTCDGPCPPDTECINTGDACVCLPVPCEQSQYPECLGDCPPGEVCDEDPTGGQSCVCRPEVVHKADWPNYAPSGMPDFSQDHQNWPPTWCGPTAVWDSFWWFDSEMECDRDRNDRDANESESNDTCELADDLGEPDPIPGTFGDAVDRDWYEFDIPHKRQRSCKVTVSTCSLRQAGDADTKLSLYGRCDDSGTPDNLIAMDDDGACLPDTQSEINVTLDPGRYYVLVEPGAAGGQTYTLSLGIDCYPIVERAGDVSDDHSEHNPSRFIPGLAACMNTDDVQGTGSGHRGTLITDMQACIDDLLAVGSLEGVFTEETVLAPPFDDVAHEIKRSEDVILLLGFYWFDGQSWLRCGGHYVTSAGVGPDEILLSDPALNNAEPPIAGPGRVRGPNHGDHAPALNPPPDHDDAQNISHDRYDTVASAVGLPAALWALGSYATFPGVPTRCEDVARWCMPLDYGQNPVDPDQVQVPCPEPDLPVSVEVEAMVDVSPVQTPVCLYLDADLDAEWPDNLRVGREPCPDEQPTLESYDVIRGKLCNLEFASEANLEVDLSHVQCIHDNVSLDQFVDVSPDQTDCFGGWFYLVRQSADPDYGTGSGGQSRLPSAGGCP